MYTKNLLLITILLIVGLIPTGNRSPVVHAAIQAPVLKWAYGGCSSFSCQTGWYSSPAVADLNNDSKPEVIWGSYDVVALNGGTGSLVWRAPNGQRVWPAIAVADLTGDGSPEVIVGRGSDQLTVYSATGGELWTRHPFGNGEVRTLAVADLENDGQQEIIVGRASGGDTKQLSVYEPDGSVRTGWPARRDGEAGYGWGMYNENVTIADYNGDGKREIIGPTDTHYITALDRNGNQLPANSMYGTGKVWSQVGVHVLQEIDLQGFADCDTDPSIPIGRKLRPNFANSAPISTDIDGDGKMELVVVGNVYNCAIGNPDADMYLTPWILNIDRTRWHGSGFDWTSIPPDPGTRPLSEDYSVIQSNVNNAVAADLDGDGKKEILFPSYDGRMYAYWLDKTQHGSWPYTIPGSGINFASEPAVVDLDGDGHAEVIFTTWPQNDSGRSGQLIILDDLGNQLSAIDLPAPRGESWNGGLAAPTVANIDSDPDLEVVVGTVASGVVAYDLPNSSNAKILWGTGRGSNRRAGVAAIEEGFSIQATPNVKVIPAAGSTTITIKLNPGDLGGTGTADLSVSATPAGPTLQLSAKTSPLPGSVTLTVTDNHPKGSLKPGFFTTITVNATSNGKTQSVKIGLLVGGYQTALPVVRH